MPFKSQAAVVRGKPRTAHIIKWDPFCEKRAKHAGIGKRMGSEKAELNQPKSTFAEESGPSCRSLAESN